MVTVKQLEQELLREKQLLQEATTYRQQTADLALQVLKKCKTRSHSSVEKVQKSLFHGHSLQRIETANWM